MAQGPTRPSGVGQAALGIAYAYVCGAADVGVITSFLCVLCDACVCRRGGRPVVTLDLLAAVGPVLLVQLCDHAVGFRQLANHRRLPPRIMTVKNSMDARTMRTGIMVTTPSAA